MGNPTDRGRLRHPDGLRVAWPSGCEYDDDLYARPESGWKERECVAQRMHWRRAVAPRSYHGTMPTGMARNTCVGDMVNKCVNRNENHRDVFALYPRTMPVSVLSSHATIAEDLP